MNFPNTVHSNVLAISQFCYGLFTHYLFVRYQVLTVGLLKIQFFCDVKMC
jgi:hypothetical protein